MDDEDQTLSEDEEELPAIASRDEVLALLSEQAREGSVTAAAALARELRAREKDHENHKDQVGSVMDQIIKRKGNGATAKA